VEATPIQLARIIGGIASGGHLVRPHSVFPDQLSPDFRKALIDTYPGTGEAYIPIDPENWETITDGMAAVTQPGAFHTAGGEHLEGIDFAGKTGTAQVMSHEALGKTNQGRATYPNVWFVGVTPRRNPELVVAVLFQNGNKSWFAARIGARVVSAYVEKQRRLANNLQPTKAPMQKPVEVGAVWTAPDANTKNPGDREAARLHAGHFFINPEPGVPESAGLSGQRHEAIGSTAARPSQLGVVLPTRRISAP
jgi:penicillin-binding protein 2